MIIRFRAKEKIEIYSFNLPRFKQHQLHALGQAEALSSCQVSWFTSQLILQLIEFLFTLSDLPSKVFNLCLSFRYLSLGNLSGKRPIGPALLFFSHHASDQHLSFIQPNLRLSDLNRLSDHKSQCALVQRASEAILDPFQHRVKLSIFDSFCVQLTSMVNRQMKILDFMGPFELLLVVFLAYPFYLELKLADTPLRLVVNFGRVMESVLQHADLSRVLELTLVVGRV